LKKKRKTQTILLSASLAGMSLGFLLMCIPPPVGILPYSFTCCDYFPKSGGTTRCVGGVGIYGTYTNYECFWNSKSEFVSFFNLNFLVFHWMDLVCQLAFLFDWFDYFFGWVCSFFVLYFQIDKIIQKTKEIQSFHVFCSHYGKIKFLFWKVIFESLFLFMGEVWMKKIN
jgi:hypothetical protein